jgi:hypothetical protein
MEKKTEGLYQHFDVPSLPHRRKLNGEEITYLAKLLTNVFDSPVEPKLIEMIMNYISFIEKKMIGRIASHVDDLVIHYLMRYFSTINTKEPISDLCHMEIGSLFGGSVILAHHAIKLAEKNIPLHVIEPFEGYYGKGKDIITKEDITEVNFIKNLGIFEIPQKHIHIHKGFSGDSNILQQCNKLKVLSLLIDGDHSYNGVKNDWINYAHLVVPGGYILIDNYNDQYWPDVMKFINNEVLSNLHGRWEVACFYSNSLLLRRTNVQGAVDISEQQQMFKELAAKDKELADLQNELQDFRKTQLEKMKSLEAEFDKANKLSDELRSEMSKIVNSCKTEIESLRYEKQKNEIEYKKQLDSMCEEKVKQIEELHADREKRTLEFSKQFDFIRNEKNRSETALTNQINQLRSEKDKLEAELKNRIEKIQVEKDKAEIEFSKQFAYVKSEKEKSEIQLNKQLLQLRDDNKAVEGWLKDQIVQILNERKKSEDLLKKQNEILKQEKLNAENRSNAAQSKYDNLNHWHRVTINSLSWKITAPIRKIKEIIFPKWKA